jgi:hypothetical protein
VYGLIADPMGAAAEVLLDTTAAAMAAVALGTADMIQ